MRILLDESGQLLALAAKEFDVFITADRGMEYQQNQGALPIAILVVLANSNRLEALAPAVPAILTALKEWQPHTLRRVVA